MERVMRFAVGQHYSGPRALLGWSIEPVHR
jgi:hypothetical protein